MSDSVTGPKKVSSKVKFGEPPPVRETAPYDWQKIAGQLRKKPGEWALIFEQDKQSLATAIRLNGIKVLRAENGFEMRTANNRRHAQPRLCDLWMRYNPDKDRSTT